MINDKEEIQLKQFLQQGQKEVADNGFSKQVSRRIARLKTISVSINATAIVIGILLVLKTNAYYTIYTSTLEAITSIDTEPLQALLLSPTLYICLGATLMLGLCQLVTSKKI